MFCFSGHLLEGIGMSGETPSDLLATLRKQFAKLHLELAAGRQEAAEARIDALDQMIEVLQFDEWQNKKMLEDEGAIVWRLLVEGDTISPGDQRWDGFDQEWREISDDLHGDSVEQYSVIRRKIFLPG
jgi:hypothetical protein